ncbi:MAG: hypothetical protein E6356_04265 [Terrisporobacter othiniensis]|uniref:SHOCT-like domain-containing protein n=1 Tax=Terrisporobacter petrolearius TaxID=1460447 RepID=UPI0022E42D70|nr:hypothetical protein [Terrisporobacter petrolearius]MDU4859791.1 hypothetical protein [Terrisporobacter othiniensis]MDU6994040.1 hypothetical protein [Terrisporobacter othiniensis]
MEDKKRILKMVEEGKITAEEAIKLLDVLDSNEKCDIVVKEEVIEDDDFFDINNDGKRGKMLFVRVKSKDGSKVKVNIPLEFIKIMGGIGSMYSNELEKYNIDIAKLMDAIDNGFVGRIVEVEDGNDKVIVEIQ